MRFAKRDLPSGGREKDSTVEVEGLSRPNQMTTDSYVSSKRQNYHHEGLESVKLLVGKTRRPCCNSFDTKQQKKLASLDMIDWGLCGEKNYSERREG